MDGKSVENSSLVAYTVLNQWKRVSSNCQMVKTYIMHTQNLLFGNKTFSIMSVTINQSIWRHVPEDLSLHQHNCQNLKCSKVTLPFTQHPKSRVALPCITIPRPTVTTEISCDCQHSTHSFSVDSEILPSFCK